MWHYLVGLWFEIDSPLITGVIVGGFVYWLNHRKIVKKLDDQTSQLQNHLADQDEHLLRQDRVILNIHNQTKTTDTDPLKKLR